MAGPSGIGSRPSTPPSSAPVQSSNVETNRAPAADTGANSTPSQGVGTTQEPGFSPESTFQADEADTKNGVDITGEGKPETEESKKIKELEQKVADLLKQLEELTKGKEAGKEAGKEGGGQCGGGGGGEKAGGAEKAKGAGKGEDILEMLRKLLQENPELAKKLLEQNPELKKMLEEADPELLKEIEGAGSKDGQGGPSDLAAADTVQAAGGAQGVGAMPNAVEM